MNNVPDIRKRLAVSQAELGVALGVTQSVISQYEKGACDPSLKVARKLIAFAKLRDVNLMFETIYSSPHAIKANEV